jgi:hypothetical protein
MTCKFLWFLLDLILLMCKIIILKRIRFCFCEKYNRIDFIMTNASMSLRSMFFKNDYQSNCWQKLNKNFYVIIFFTSNQDSSRNKICSARDVVVWNEQKDINDQDSTNKSSHQDTRIRKKKKRRSTETSKTSLFYSWCIRWRKSINIFIYSTRVFFFSLSSFFDEFVEKNSQSNCNNSMIIWNEQKKFVFVFFDEIVDR